MVTYFALGGKMLALLHSGRLAELLQLLREGAGSEADGSDPWLFTYRGAWLRLLVLDLDGARRLCDTIVRRAAADPLKVQPRTIALLAEGRAAIDDGRPDDARRSFAEILDATRTPRFFLHWYWRLHAQLGLCDARLASGEHELARAEAERFADPALATSDPNLHALAWEARARVALDEQDRPRAAALLTKGLAVVERFAVPLVAWRVHASAWRLHRETGNDEAAEAERARAEAVVQELAGALEGEATLRRSFLAAPPVRSILRARSPRR